MNIIKKILLLITIFLTLYVLHRLFKNRTELLNKYNNTNFNEGYENKSTNPNTRNLSLLNYFIKASYNSCLGSDGSTISVNTLKDVLQRGYRFIDFEIALINNTIQVCANTTYKDDSNQDTSNTILFDDALDTVKTYGLTYKKDSAPNYLEPLFINLRLKNNGVSISTNVYNSIYNSIYNKLNSFLFPNINSNGTTVDIINVTLSSIINGSRKCFILLDTTSIGNTYISSSLNNIVHLAGGFNSKVLRYFSYNELTTNDLYNTLNDNSNNTITQSRAIVSSDGTLNKKTIDVSIPVGKQEKPNVYPFDFVKLYSIQICTMNASLKDDNLKIYEDIFVTSSSNSYITGFISMEKTINIANTFTKPDSLIHDIKRGIVIGFLLLCTVSGFFMFSNNTK